MPSSALNFDLEIRHGEKIDENQILHFNWNYAWVLPNTTGSLLPRNQFAIKLAAAQIVRTQIHMTVEIQYFSVL